MNSCNEKSYGLIDELKNKFIPIIAVTREILKEQEVNSEVKKLVDVSKNYFSNLLDFFKIDVNPYQYIVEDYYFPKKDIPVNSSFLEQNRKNLENLVNTLNKVEEGGKIENPETINEYLDYLTIPIKFNY